jgi:hypothetical protein
MTAAATVADDVNSTPAFAFAGAKEWHPRRPLDDQAMDVSRRRSCGTCPAAFRTHSVTHRLMSSTVIVSGRRI